MRRKKTDFAVVAEDVNKTYPGGKGGTDLKAVDNLSFTVPAASCFGLLGPNGAGKTTMMKMLHGKAVRDSARTLRVFGYDPARQSLEIKSLTGIVPQEDSLDQELTVEQNLKIYARFYGIPGKTATQRIGELLEFMQLNEKRKTAIRDLSGGMRRRLVIARALINDPKLLILDEPTTGLDPQVRHLIWEKLSGLKKQGVTLLLTTHYMEEAFQICDSLIMMHRGKKVLEGIPSALIRDNIEKFVLEVMHPPRKLKSLCPEGVRMEKTETRAILYGNSFRELQSCSEALGRHEHYLRQSNLEDVFLKTTGRHLDEGA